MERTEDVKKFYTSLESMKLKFDKFARKDKVNASTLEEFIVWKNHARETLFDLLGLDKMENCESSCKVLELTTIEEGITREKRILETEPGVWMPFYVLYPKEENLRYVVQSSKTNTTSTVDAHSRETLADYQGNKTRKPACMIAVQGHSGGGKESIAGRREIPSIADAIDKFQYDYGLELAKLGFITLCPDARGFGERREEAFQKEDENSYLNGACYQLAHMVEPLGMTVVGMLTWDLMRLVDWIEQSMEWDMTELGCVGFSGGGMQTLMLGAMDERVRQCIISGYLYGYKDSLLVLNGNCNCNYVPHLWEYFDMGDIGSLLAPRKVCIQSCLSDHLNGVRGIENVNEQVEIMRQVYELFDAKENLTQDIRDGGHCFHKEVLAEFL